METPDCVTSVEDASRPEDVATVNKGLDAYNLQFAPPENLRPLNVFLRTSEQVVVGGLIGVTYWGWLYVDRLWVDEGRRRRGYGRRLLAAAEAEALQRGCRHVHLDTLTFQALGFYERQGYAVWGVLEDLPPGHRRYYLKKDLA
jgi:GNAT superfamily N-acetyltransferase